MSKMKPLYCPTCRNSVRWENNPWRPFCSERCKLIDLGAWSSESYRIPEQPEAENGEGWSEAESGG
ncbi:MAG: DNA gyrase inhibitor YacG [Holophagales bacterium]|nr:DNA gyrase inhibitor YacG [Holophagales bacterium]